MHIGLFDSGVGGLTVLKEIRNEFPNSKISYLGDTARLPYGNKAPQTLQKYTDQNIQFLDQLSVDAIVIACHSASSVSLSLKSSAKGTPIFNVIQPSCEDALQVSEHNRIGVLATIATTLSQVYPKTIRQLEPTAHVISQQCPLLVPLVEEGLIVDEVTQIVLRRYLKTMLEQDVETLLLGCTHYPILADEISQICSSQIKLIDPALSVAKRLRSLNYKQQSTADLHLYLTDHAPHFLRHAKKLLNITDALEVRSASLSIFIK